MNIQMMGIDHNLASVDVRALFSFTTKGAEEAMQAVCKIPHVSGCIILSTCNRMEIWVNTTDEQERLPILETLCVIKGLDPMTYRKYFVTRHNHEAIEHLFRMTSGLESLILGEDQILTQVKAALDKSRECQCTDSVLETLFRMAVTGAKKVKGGMQRSMTNVSAIEQAVKWLKAEKHMSMKGRTCLVIGNGEMGKRAAQAFLAEGCDVTVTVREYRSGIVQIPPGCKRINYSERYEKIPSSDFVVSATSSPNMTLTFDAIQGFEESQSQTNRIYIDLAVPRDIDARIRELPGVELYDIDDFHVKQSEENEAIIQHADEQLQEQIQEFIDWFNGRDMIPRIRQIGKNGAEDAYWRMGKTVKKLELDKDEELLLQTACETAVDKVIQKMLFTIRNEAGMDVLRQCLDVLSESEE